jgi:hypothetical protein
LLLGCASAPAVEEPAAELPRHTELVEAKVLRSVSGEPAEAMDECERVAVVEIASNLDPLEAEVVQGFRLDVSTTLETDTPSTLRVKALVAVHTVGPPEQMRAMLQGTGTVQRGTDRAADLRLATAGAVRAALRRLLPVCRRFG